MVVHGFHYTRLTEIPLPQAQQLTAAGALQARPEPTSVPAGARVQSSVVGVPGESAWCRHGVSAHRPTCTCTCTCACACTCHVPRRQPVACPARRRSRAQPGPPGIYGVVRGRGACALPLRRRSVSHFGVTRYVFLRKFPVMSSMAWESSCVFLPTRRKSSSCGLPSMSLFVSSTMIGTPVSATALYNLGHLPTHDPMLNKKATSGFCTKVLNVTLG